jgi:uncharacterized protein YecT (DUF1311 family)
MFALTFSRGLRSAALLLSAALMCAASASTFAQSKQATPPDPCASLKTTLDMNECEQQHLNRDDKELNAAYQRLLGKLKPDAEFDKIEYAAIRRKLVEAQRHWVQFREKDCSAQYDLHIQGSIRNLVYLGCMRKHTQERTKDLLKWVEG